MLVDGAADASLRDAVILDATGRDAASSDAAPTGADVVILDFAVAGGPVDAGVADAVVTEAPSLDAFVPGPLAASPPQLSEARSFRDETIDGTRVSALLIGGDPDRDVGFVRLALLDGSGRLLTNASGRALIFLQPVYLQTYEREAFEVELGQMTDVRLPADMRVELSFVDESGGESVRRLTEPATLPVLETGAACQLRQAVARCPRHGPCDEYSYQCEPSDRPRIVRVGAYLEAASGQVGLEVRGTSSDENARIVDLRYQWAVNGSWVGAWTYATFTHADGTPSLSQMDGEFQGTALLDQGDRTKTSLTDQSDHDLPLGLGAPLHWPSGRRSPWPRSATT